jgi:hypothetical protein
MFLVPGWSAIISTQPGPVAVRQSWARLGPSEAGSGAGILCLSGYLDTEGRIWCHGVTGSGAASARAAGVSREIVFVIVNAAGRVCCEGLCV